MKREKTAPEKPESSTPRADDKPRLTQKSLSALPKNIAINTPILQLKETPQLSIQSVCERAGLVPRKIEDNLGEVYSVIFTDNLNNRWFHAYEDIPSSGLTFECAAKSNEDLYIAFENTLKTFDLGPGDIAWISETIVDYHLAHYQQGAKDFSTSVTANHTLANAAISQVECM